MRMIATQIGQKFLGTTLATCFWTHPPNKWVVICVVKPQFFFRSARLLSNQPHGQICYFLLWTSWKTCVHCLKATQWRLYHSDALPHWSSHFQQALPSQASLSSLSCQAECFVNPLDLCDAPLGRETNRQSIKGRGPFKSDQIKLYFYSHCSWIQFCLKGLNIPNRRNTLYL